LEHLGQGIPIDSLTPNAQNQLRLLLGLSERACEVVAQHRILESLAFEGMYGRYEDVDEAHFETLRWIYDDNLYTHNKDKYKDQEKTSAREMLLNWILSGAGIFHISGKLGSGKSTLIKYLSDHNRTNELLGQWAGNYLRFSYSLYNGLIIIIRRTPTSLRSFLLLEAGVKDAEITCRPY
jgi:dipeptidyl aminopeptidase/acylaminoacyl peptidase